MQLRKSHRSLLAALSVSALLILVPLFLLNCGGQDYDDPQAQVDVMISPDTLNGWVTNGYGTDSFGYDKMVILDVNSQSGYAAGHVPGAFLLDTSVDLSATRSNGVSETISQVATKAQMDDLIQRTGIDASTVVVLTAPNGNFQHMNLGRAYFNFRYWGFPKSRLRVMYGSTAVYSAAGYPLETTSPAAPAPSSYSVCNLTQDTSVRASLGEMIAVAEDSDPSTVPIDSRSTNEYDGVAGGTKVDSSVPTVVAFEGHIRTAVSQNYSGLMSGGELIPKADLLTAMAAIGVDGSTTTYSYCRTSWRAAITFLALDAVLGWPTKIYDGAWIEWGQMADNSVTYDGSLDAASNWRTDTASRSELITYNKPNGFIVEPLTSVNSFAPRADKINRDDSLVCGGGAGGGGGSPEAPGY